MHLLSHIFKTNFLIQPPFSVIIHSFLQMLPCSPSAHAALPKIRSFISPSRQPYVHCLDPSGEDTLLHTAPSHSGTASGTGSRSAYAAAKECPPPERFAGRLSPFLDQGSELPTEATAYKGERDAHSVHPHLQSPRSAPDTSQRFDLKCDVPPEDHGR